MKPCFCRNPCASLRQLYEGCTGARVAKACRGNGSGPMRGQENLLELLYYTGKLASVRGGALGGPDMVV